MLNGEFDSGDKEDVIFVAPINKNAEGTYGIYDYEIRVPAKLREYNSADSKAAVFYVEILLILILNFIFFIIFLIFFENFITSFKVITFSETFINLQNHFNI